MAYNELDMFIQTWEREAKNTERLLQSLPSTQYDFRPDPQGRSLGELAWHLAEVDAYMSRTVIDGKVDFQTKIAGLERPRAVAELAPGYARVHSESVKALKAMKPELIERMIDFMGRPMRGGDVLWNVLLFHAIHHRGQLMLLSRLAGGVPPGIYGPSREEMAAMRGA